MSHRAAIATMLTLFAGSAIAADAGEPDAQPEKLAFGELPKNTGWLSDPNTPAQTIWDSLGGGKLHLNDRIRFEYADSDGRKPSYAFTNRIRLGYETKAWNGLSGMIEMENVFTPDKTLYFVPPTGDGDPTRTVIAEPPDTEVNQAWGRYRREALFDSEAWVDIKAGRQRLTFDDQRFIGNVGWRQFEQTLDAARVDLGSGPLTFTYAYVWGVQRIFSEGTPNWEGDTHLFHGVWKAADWVNVKPFVYLYDFEESASNSNNTYGVRLDGKFPLGEENGFSLAYELTYARQEDSNNNPVDYEADFFATDISVSKKGVGTLGVGYQLLGSDDGTMGFRVPLGTNHAFNGWADLFLTTPAVGLQDFFVYAKASLPWDVKGAVFYHKFWSDEGSDELGWELDAVFTKKISRNWVLLTKFAYFDGSTSGYADITRFWLETTFKF